MFGPNKSLVTVEHLQEFIRDGVTVIEGVLDDEEVAAARRGFHEQMEEMTGVKHEDVLTGSGEKWKGMGARLKSPASRMFYKKWKLLGVNLKGEVVDSMEEVLRETFGRKIPGFEHPFEPFTNSLLFVDRAHYRLPDTIQAEGGLGLHLDMNPYDPYLTEGTGLRRWRPIQSIVTLTDHYGGESGGLKVIKGFHRKMDEFFGRKGGDNPNSKGGEFYRMISKSYEGLQKQCQPVTAPAGSLVLWDTRIPHSTSPTLSGHDTREVLYSCMIPDIELNRQFAAEQYQCLLRNTPPPMFGSPDETADRDFDLATLSPYERQHLGEGM